MERDGERGREMETRHTCWDVGRKILHSRVDKTGTMNHHTSSEKEWAPMTHGNYNLKLEKRERERERVHILL